MISPKRIYLDNAATTPVDPAVLKAMLPYFSDIYGNPSSLHEEGRLSKKAIDEARINVSKNIGAKADEIIFTSGGTESDNLALLGLARANKNKGKHIIVSSIEHKAVLDVCKKLIKEGFEVTFLSVDKEGIISLKELENSLRPDTILVSIMFTNNEIGSIQPLKEIAKILKTSKICEPIFHTDASQAIGLLPVDVEKLGIDAMSFNASKIYGPKGIGCLYLKEGLTIEPLIIGGGQENGFRSGTENTPLIVGLAKALEIAEQKREKEIARLTILRDYFITKVLKEIKGTSLNGGIKIRLSNNINISISGAEGESLVLLLDDRGIACSTGSACNAVDLKPSYVLTNIGVSEELAHCSLRFTLGRQTTKKDLDLVIKNLKECVEIVRCISTIKA